MKFIGRLLLTIGISLLSLTMQAQKEYNKAEKAYENYEYYKAIELYKEAFLKTNNKPRKAEITFKLAECYRLLNDPKQAKLWYQKAIQVKYPDPIIVMRYADMLKMNGAFDEAIIQYEKYRKLVPDDPRGKQGIESSKLVQKWVDNPTRYTVENMAFFNSKMGDYCPTFGKKDFRIVYFTSTREGASGNEFNYVSGQNFSDIFGTTMDRKGNWSVPTAVQGDASSEHDDGVASLNYKGGVMYFTRCEVVKKVDVKCKLYYSKKMGLGFGYLAPVNIGNDTISYGQPSLSRDENTLYFVAKNLPGGYGGNDIWMLKRESKRDDFEPIPINLGQDINTPGNEMFPYIRKDGVLFFSSDYHIGIGGLDIFKATPNKGGGYKIENLKYPINSPSDDFGICFYDDQEKGFFSSKRPGGKGMEDIYSFILPPLQFEIKGIVKNEETNQVIPGATVKLVGSDGTTLEVLSEADGSFRFKLEPQTDYVVETAKEDYLKGKGKETTKGLEEDKSFEMPIYMTPIPKPEDGGIEVENIFYDYAEATLRPESKVALDKLVEILTDNNTLVIELRAHTDFRGSDERNQQLSQERAQSVIDYLIEKGINSKRLVPKGMGENEPATVSKKYAEKYPGFLKEGDVLTEEFIKGLATVEEQDVAHQINRRTDFKVLSQDFTPAPESQVPAGEGQEGTQE